MALLFNLQGLSLVSAQTFCCDANYFLRSFYFFLFLWQTAIATATIRRRLGLVRFTFVLVQLRQFGFPLLRRQGHNRECVHRSIIAQFVAQALIDHAVPRHQAGCRIKARRYHHYLEMRF